jgi:sugar lactone lactonase YvrE
LMSAAALTLRVIAALAPGRVPARVVALMLAAAAIGPARADEPTTLVYPPFGHCLGLHRATKVHLFLYLGTRTHFDDPEGIAAVKLAALDDPSTTSDDDELTVFGLNSGQGELIYNTSLTSVETFGEPGDGDGQFRDPLGVAADERGNVFVADTGNDRVVRLLYDEGHLRFIKNFYLHGSPLSSPSDISIGASGALYVADTGNDRIVRMSPTGEFLGAVTGDSDKGVSLERPTGVAVVEGTDPWISRNQDFMVVVDRGGRRLVKLSRDGRLSSLIEAGELPVSDASFGRVAIDYYGSVYATDRANGAIHKFDRGLAYVTSVGKPGHGHMEMDQPRGITLWRRFGQIFITEREGAQYFWIGTDILNLSADPPRVIAGGEPLRLRYFLTEVSRVTVDVVDEHGDVIHTLVRNRRRAIGRNVERWDGTLGRGGPSVHPGRYTLRITATPTYSSGEYFHDTDEVVVTVEGPGGSP